MGNYLSFSSGGGRCFSNSVRAKNRTTGTSNLTYWLSSVYLDDSCYHFPVIISYNIRNNKKDSGEQDRLNQVITLLISSSYESYPGGCLFFPLFPCIQLNELIVIFDGDTPCFCISSSRIVDLAIKQNVLQLHRLSSILH